MTLGSAGSGRAAAAFMSPMFLRAAIAAGRTRSSSAWTTADSPAQGCKTRFCSTRNGSGFSAI